MLFRSIDVQYYIYHLDTTGGLLTAALLRAADRGVRVRMLLDDGDTVAGDEKLLALEAHPNIELRVFNPFVDGGHSNLVRAVEVALSAGRADYRMHNKLLVVDNAIALAGGRNVGDEYFQVDPVTHFGDDDVVAAGPVVREMSASFDEYWNSELAVPAGALKGRSRPSGNPAPQPSAQQRLHELRETLATAARAPAPAQREALERMARGEPLVGLRDGRLPLTWAPAQLVYDSPDKRREMTSGGFSSIEPVRAAIAAVKSELLIVTPFLVPEPEDLALLEQLRQRGVTVRVLTNSLAATPESAVHSAYQRYRAPLLERGMHLYEVRPHPADGAGPPDTASTAPAARFALHAKLFVFDRQRLFVGSLNLDRRSARRNTEIGLLIDSPELARATAEHFATMTRPENCYALRLLPAAPGQAPSLVWLTRHDGQLVALDRDPARGPWQRLAVQLLSLLPLDNEL